MTAEVVAPHMYEAALYADGSPIETWIVWLPDDIGGAYEKLEALLRSQGIKDIDGAMASVQMREYWIH